MNAMNKQDLLLTRVWTLCTQTDAKRGIWKRIDENRELLEFLQTNAPEFLNRFSFIEIWLGNQDIFLVNLLRLLELPECVPCIGSNFPRKWPGEPCIEKAYLSFTPAIAAIMALPVAETPNEK